MIGIPSGWEERAAWVWARKTSAEERGRLVMAYDFVQVWTAEFYLGGLHDWRVEE